mmetsp:Transcript_16041/g.32068  ORF Transcript_16041/g.32068 Transcript_16041/m.32068 type:complete len:173 (+) Transcript_16041:27-545(+)
MEKSAVVFACLLGLVGHSAAFSLGLRLPSVRHGAPVGMKPPTFLPHPSLRRNPASISSVRCQFADDTGAPMDKEPIECSEENVQLALEECKQILQTMFGNFEENRNIGITGDVSLADIDGPFITLRLEGRFWHKRADVLARVTNYLLTRIPEIVDVSIEDPAQLDDLNPDNQ